jgi:hypothetical protein
MPHRTLQPHICNIKRSPATTIHVIVNNFLDETDACAKRDSDDILAPVELLGFRFYLIILAIELLPL